MQRKQKTVIRAAAVTMLSAFALTSAYAQAPATPAKPADAKAAPAPQAPAVPAQAKAEAPKPVDVFAMLPDTIAEIGDKKITKQQFVGEITQQYPVEAFQAAPAEQLKPIFKQMINGMVDREILLAMVDKAGIKPSPELVKAEFDKMLASLPPEKADMFRKQIELSGKKLDDYKNEISKNPDAQKGIAVSKWVEANVNSKIKIPDADIEKFYRENQESFKIPETVEASHILVLSTGMTEDGKKLDEKAAADADAAAKKKIEGILARLKQGESFEAIAEKESDCPSGKNAKGSLGKFPRGKMVPEFDAAVFAIEKPGQMTDIVKTPYGYHIIKLTAKNPASYTQLDDKLKKEIKDYLVQTESEKQVKAAIAKEKETLKVKVSDF